MISVIATDKKTSAPLYSFLVVIKWRYSNTIRLPNEAIRGFCGVKKYKGSCSKAVNFLMLVLYSFRKLFNAYGQFV